MDNESITGIIYKTTNLINGKIYIGQTIRSNYSNYYGSGKLVNYAIDKYGLSAFEKEILCECFNRKELNEKEIYWIANLSACNLNIGYNIADGGKGGFTTSHTKKTRKIISLKNSGRVHLYHKILKKGRYIKKENLSEITILLELGFEYGQMPVSKETRKKLSKVSKGSKLTKEHKQKLSKAHKGKVFTKEHKHNIGKASKGRKHSKENIRKFSKTLREMKRKWISNDIEQKSILINSVDLEKLIKLGWYVGRTYYKRK